MTSAFSGIMFPVPLNAACMRFVPCTCDVIVLFMSFLRGFETSVLLARIV